LDEAIIEETVPLIAFLALGIPAAHNILIYPVKDVGIDRNARDREVGKDRPFALFSFRVLQCRKSS
jgi:hypothetical protein